MSLTASESTAGRRRAADPRTSRGQRTRRLLMEAAIEIIGAQGIAAARVHDIADRAGCGYGTFYKYFDSKIDLMRQVIAEVFEELLEGSLPPFARGSSQEEIIRLSITGLVDTLIRVWPVFKALGRVASLDPELMTLRDVLLHRRVEELAQRIIRMERAGYGQIADPYLVSLALASMTDEMARRWVLYEGQISREEFIEVLVAIFEMTLLGRRNERTFSGPVRPLVIEPQS